MASFKARNMVLNSSSPGQERAIEFARGGVFTEQDAKGVENSAVADVGDCREGQYHYPTYIVPPLGEASVSQGPGSTVAVLVLLAG